MERYRTIAILCSIALAVIVPLSLAVKAGADLKSHPVVLVEVEPYDPRDLFYGHYMRYVFKWNWQGGKADDKVCKDASCCLCLGAEATDPEASLVSCAVIPPESNCTHTLQGNYLGANRFDIGIDRYYVDEEIALPLEKLFQNKKERFHVGLSLRPNGMAVSEQLYVGGMTTRDYVTTKGVEKE